MNVRGIAGGALALIALQVVVTSPQTGRLGELLALPAAWARTLIDPNVPAIADHSGAADITKTTTTATAAAPARGIPGGFDSSTVTV